MNISSGQYIFNIPHQSNCSLQVQLPKNCYTGNIIQFGMSGTTNELVSVSGGNIYDSYDRNIFSVNFEENIFYNLYISSGSCTNKINQNILSKTSNTGIFDNIFLYTNQNIDIGFSFSGEIPSVSINQLNNFSGTNKIITGTIANNTPNLTFKITGFNIKNNTGLYSVSGYPTGLISGTHEFYISAQTGIILTEELIPIEMITNFGTINFDINSEP